MGTVGLHPHTGGSATGNQPVAHATAHLKKIEMQDKDQAKAKRAGGKMLIHQNGGPLSQAPGGLSGAASDSCLGMFLVTTMMTDTDEEEESFHAP